MPLMRRDTSPSVTMNAHTMTKGPVLTILTIGPAETMTAMSAWNGHLLSVVYPAPSARMECASLIVPPTITNPVMITMFIGMIPATPERTNQANAETLAGLMNISVREVICRENG